MDPETPAARAACKQLMWALTSELKDWLARMSREGGCPFRYNVLPEANRFQLQVSVGLERVTVSILDPDTIQIDDPTTEASLTTTVPFLAGISPVLMDAIKREMANQMQK